MPVHASPLSGTWYPDSPAALEALLDNLWKKSEERTGAFVLPGGRAFLAPHAGLVYSGTVAAAVYRHLERQQPRCVIVAGFSHRGAPDGIAIPDIDAYQTPIGKVPVDSEMAGAISSALPFRRSPESLLCDHSVEIQLPLLRKALPQATVVPLYVGRLDQAARSHRARVGAHPPRPTSNFQQRASDPAAAQTAETCSSSATRKEEPQPQAATTLGLFTLKPAPCRLSS